jgi:hypothetical protein
VNKRRASRIDQRAPMIQEYAPIEKAGSPRVHLHKVGRALARKGAELGV